MGGGALFCALQPQVGTLGDKNAELINCYQHVQKNPTVLIAHLQQMENSEEEYYKIRSQAPENPVERAARFIYLTTLAFNGIYRENSRGVFNVPYGHKSHLNPCDPDRIVAVSKALAGIRILHADFEETVADAVEGDLIYLDPPYTVTHSNNGFIKYNARVFSWEDQKRLAAVAARLAESGCKVLVSNADHPSIWELYGKFKMQRVTRPSVISASRSGRRRITECIFFN